MNMSTKDFIIYENREDAKVYIKVPKGIETYFQLQNLPGKVLQESLHDKGLHDFDLSGLPDGNYFVVVNQEDVIKSKKIVIGYHP